MIVDVDGNEYIDWVSSWGPLIAGHAHTAVIDAVASAATRGTSFGAPTEGEVELAAEVARRIPSAQMLRMTSSGTEATMSALRLARAVTGRERVLKFAGAYHGHVDGLLAEGGSGLATQGIPASPGVPTAAAQATVIVPWNDRPALIAATEEHSLAAILAEPVAANMGVVPPADGFLELLRERADETGALLVFDEVITGFRVAAGGAGTAGHRAADREKSRGSRSRAAALPSRNRTIPARRGRTTCRESRARPAEWHWHIRKPPRKRARSRSTRRR